MYFQHGDILIKRADAIPEGADKLPHLCFLKSPTTGHEHKLAEGSAALLFKSSDGVIYADVGEPSQLVHDEHKPITIPPGIWWMDQVREYNPETDEVRAVVD